MIPPPTRRRLSRGTLTALLVLLAPSCDDGTAPEPAAEVAISLLTVSTPSLYTTPLGHVVELETAYANVAVVELIPCPSVADLVAPLRSVARAHSPSTPVRDGEPQVVDLFSTLGLPIPVAALEPPFDIYCTIELVLSAADQDAGGLPTDIDMVGSTLIFEGMVTQPGGSPEPFSLRSSEYLYFSIPFTSIFETSEDAAEWTILLETDHMSWLDEVDFGAGTDSEREAALAAGISTSLSLATSAP